MPKVNVNKGSGSTTLAFRMSTDDVAYLKSLASRKQMTVTSFVRAHMLDFLAKEATKDWVAETLPGMIDRMMAGRGAQQSRVLLEAIFASYHMLYEIVEARDPQASKRAIELGKKDAEHELRNAAP